MTLTGRVLPIGGVKEKTLAARRSGVHTIVFPEANRKDYEELSGMVVAACNPIGHPECMPMGPVCFGMSLHSLLFHWGTEHEVPEGCGCLSSLSCRPSTRA